MNNQTNHKFLLETSLYSMFIRSATYTDATFAVDETDEGTIERVVANIRADLAEQDLLAETKRIWLSTDDRTMQVWAAALHEFISKVREKREAATREMK